MRYVIVVPKSKARKWEDYAKDNGSVMHYLPTRIQHEITKVLEEYIDMGRNEVVVERLDIPEDK